MAPEEKDVELTDSDGNKWSGTVEKESTSLGDMAVEAIDEVVDSVTWQK